MHAIDIDNARRDLATARPCGHKALMASERQSGQVWRPYSFDPLPSTEEALALPFRAFPSWFLRIVCGRCGQERVINEAHAPWRAMRLVYILRRMRHHDCGGLPAYVELLSSVEGVSSRPVRRIVLRAADDGGDL